jgi:hypothetical protein
MIICSLLRLSMLSVRGLFLLFTFLFCRLEEGKAFESTLSLTALSLPTICDEVFKVDSL